MISSQGIPKHSSSEMNIKNSQMMLEPVLLKKILPLSYNKPPKKPPPTISNTLIFQAVPSESRQRAKSKKPSHLNHGNLISAETQPIPHAKNSKGQTKDAIPKMSTKTPAKYAP